MKRLLLLTLLLIAIVTPGFTQNKLSNSRISSLHTFIYKLTDQETFKISAKSAAVINESYLHTVVDSFYTDKPALFTKKLPYGSYLYVNAEKNKLNYKFVSVANVALKFINNRKDFQFTISDLAGRPITDAVVIAGKGKSIKYNGSAGLYLSGRGAKVQVITVKHDGVSNFFNYGMEEEERPKPAGFWKRLFHGTEDREGMYLPKYTGYLVFNKPIYKPLDTVKFKAYLLKQNGEDLHNIPLKVELSSGSNSFKNRDLTTLLPYRAGGYEYSFPLADSLNLRLDNSYTISLKEKKGKYWERVYYRDFRYEEYELKAINFSVRSNQGTHRPGNPATVFMKAVDENELAVPDGRVTVTAIVSNVLKYHGNQVFVKDTLWKKELQLDPVGETKLVLPDSIFPKADLSLRLKFEFLNSNNERRESTQLLDYLMEDREVKFLYQKDSLHLDYLVKGKSVPQKAILYQYVKDNKVLDSTDIQLPARVKMNLQAVGYRVKTRDGLEGNIALSQLQAGINISATKGKDSLQIAVNNAHQLPFWYTVFSGDQVLFRGSGTKLDTLLKHSNLKAAYVRVNYLWADKEQYQEVSAFYTPHQLKVKLSGPDVVYPGETVQLQVKVTDMENQPVAATDLTAYGATTKFKTMGNVVLPNFGKVFSLRKETPELQTEQVEIKGGLKLNWERWSKELGLDSIQYYQFVRTKGLYEMVEAGLGDSTIVAPFVVRDGSVEPVNLIYIDNIPVYFSQANQLQPYAFKVVPGKHNLKMRTFSHLIELKAYDFRKGAKIILSVAADRLNPKAEVTVAPPKLTGLEAQLLTKFMIRVENNFEDQKTLISAKDQVVLLNPPFEDTHYDEVLTGPFPDGDLKFNSGSIERTFAKEPGYTYTFSPGLLKQKSYPANNSYGFDLNLWGNVAANHDNYQQYPLNKVQLDSIWNAYLDLRSTTTSLFLNLVNEQAPVGNLYVKPDPAFERKIPAVKNILIYNDDDPYFLHIYPGNQSGYLRLPAGKYRMMYLLKDNSYFKAEELQVKKNGVNYYALKERELKRSDDLSLKIDQLIKSVKDDQKEEAALLISEDISGLLNHRKIDPAAVIYQMSGNILDERSKNGVHRAKVRVKGLKEYVLTDLDGAFKIGIPQKGTLVISAKGFIATEVMIRKGNIGNVFLQMERQYLQEQALYGVSSHGYSRSKPAPGKNKQADKKIVLRGANLQEVGQKPIVIVDGLPFNGDVSSLDANLIAEMNILKGEDAVGIYGSRAANGVILIKTKAGNTTINTAGEIVAGQQTMRSKFSDYAIWQPQLVTDAEGKAAFSVKFPDDITSWTARVIALNGHKQGGFTETKIRSFKTLSANLVSPQFALVGDSIQVIGKLMNYNNGAETVSRTFKYNNSLLLNNTLTFKNAKIDTIGIVAKAETVENQIAIGADSLKFEYVMKQENGYFDGEFRKIPLLQTGVLETKGYFNALSRDTTITYKFDAALGKVTLNAEASVFPALLDEMEKLRRYEYLCNEQMASKLKALLMEKKVRKYLGEEFRGERNIKELVKKLQQNKRTEGTWGWWQNSEEELWISLQVTEALLQAEKEGYGVVINKDKMFNYLIGKIGTRKNFDQIYAVRLLNMLGNDYSSKVWVEAVEQQQLLQKGPGVVTQSLYEKLQLMELKQQAGLAVDVKWLLSVKKSTMFGNLYWGDENYRFWDNSIQNTILAYRILKAAGQHQDELERIQRYFLEQKKDGQWRNTYESSLILETILPELLVNGNQPEAASVTLNKEEKITVFPFKKVLEPKTLTIEKKGNMPVYFTAYQQFNNPEPEKVSKQFIVKSWFDQNGGTVQKLKAGTMATLKVEVEVKGDAAYVMIEIPIPAGCSYERKLQSFWGVESHREYFKHKTSIFCTQLKQGKYTFDIELMPRYSGSYHLNPAKAEMMYFPVFYGREGMKKVIIR